MNLEQTLVIALVGASVTGLSIVLGIIASRWEQALGVIQIMGIPALLLLVSVLLLLLSLDDKGVNTKLLAWLWVGFLFFLGLAIMAGMLYLWASEKYKDGQSRSFESWQPQPYEKWADPSIVLLEFGHRRLRTLPSALNAVAIMRYVSLAASVACLTILGVWVL